MANNGSDVTTTNSLKAGIKKALKPARVQTGQQPDGTRQDARSSATMSPHPGHTSPGLHSPTSSSIFERNVQEPVSPRDPTPAIPTHIISDDRIPPALEASSLAITDARLSPDKVEIVTHAAHQPAAATISENMTSSTTLSQGSSPHSRRPSNPLPDAPPPSTTTPHQKEGDETGLNYGSLDQGDVRRLSFISFADVVQGEHAETTWMGQAMTSSVPSEARSPAGSAPGGDIAEDPQHHQHGKLAIETMRQALRRTASKELTANAVSAPASRPLSSSVTPP